MQKQKEDRGCLIRLANDDDQLGYLAVSDWYSSIPEPSGNTEQELQGKMTVCMRSLLEKARHLHPDRENDFGRLRKRSRKN
jgi:hypothetical protein